jgi:hypothetical protein
MKTFLTVMLTTLVLTFSSCDLINELIPDVDTTFPATFQIQIFANSGVSYPEIIDVTSSEDYNDFKDNIEGFELNKITYLIKNANVPDDMYCSGQIICSNEENTESYTIGSIARINISQAATVVEETEIPKAAENVDKILGWLDSPGKFIMKSDYSVTNADATPYVIDGLNAGSNFELEIKFYVTVKTKTKNS